MAADDLVLVAGSLGKLWKARRRSLPHDVTEAYVSLLFSIRGHLLSDAAKSPDVNIRSIRREVRDLVDLLASLTCEAMCSRLFACVLPCR